jgi:cell wall assembly regulator SMI1
MQRLHWFDELRIGNCLAPDREPLDARAIDELETAFRIRLPRPYKELIAVHHGDGPLQSDFVLHTQSGIQTRGIGNLLEIERWQDSNVYDHAEYMIDDVVPFAEDGGGNLICFDYRHDHSRETPSIVFWDHELDNLLSIADTFDSFIEMLFVPQDVIDDLAKQGLLPDEFVR